MYFHFSNPGAHPPLAHSSSILPEHGAEVIVVGMTASATSLPTWPPRAGVRVGVVPTRETELCLKLDYVRYAYLAVQETCGACPDWVYISEAGAAPIGLVAQRLLGIHIVYHGHAERFVPRVPRLTRAILRVRMRLARAGEVVVVPNEHRAERLRTQSWRGAPFRVIRHCPRHVGTDPTWLRTPVPSGSSTWDSSLRNEFRFRS